MREPTTEALHKLLVLLTRADIVAPYSNLALSILEQRKQATSHQLQQPNGRLALSKRWSITDRGREAIEAPR